MNTQYAFGQQPVASKVTIRPGFSRTILYPSPAITPLLISTVVMFIVRENVCNNSKKRKKSCFFGF